MLSNSRLQDLQNKQLKMDNFIFKLHNTSRSETLQERKLSFFVEVAELVNEHRGFKYWSVKPASKKHILLEEFADALHFILSLSTDAGINFLQGDYHCTPVVSKKNITDATLNLFGFCHKYTTDPNPDNFCNLMESFMTLGVLLKFTDNEIEEAYNKKHRVNYARQEDNY